MDAQSRCRHEMVLKAGNCFNLLDARGASASRAREKMHPAASATSRPSRKVTTTAQTTGLPRAEEAGNGAPSGGRMVPQTS